MLVLSIDWVVDVKLIDYAISRKFKSMNVGLQQNDLQVVLLSGGWPVNAPELRGVLPAQVALQQLHFGSAHVHDHKTVQRV